MYFPKVDIWQRRRRAPASPLDSQPGAAWAGSIWRLLRSGHVGPITRFAREPGGQEADFEAGSYGTIRRGEVLDFLDGSTPRCVNVYDQSGGGKDAGTLFADPPDVVLDGAGGAAYIQFAPGRSYLFSVLPFPASVSFSGYSVGAVDISDAGLEVLWYNGGLGGIGYGYAGQGSSGRRQLLKGAAISTDDVLNPLAYREEVVACYHDEGSGSTMKVNGIPRLLDFAATDPTTPAGSLILGQHATVGGEGSNARFYELLLYMAFQPPVIGDAIHAEQRAFYKI